MGAALVDTHCHLDLAAFDADREAVIQRAREQSVKRIIVPAVDFPSIERALALAGQYVEIYAAVGIHPNDIPQEMPLAEARARIQDAAQHPRVVAIGEIGLDYHWDNTPHDVQQDWLRMQLELAGELGLPVILHNREATQDSLRIASGWATSALPDALNRRPGVFHSFSGSWADAEAMLEGGFYLGFTGPLTFKKAEELRDVAARVPSDRVLVETDGPFLAPHPHRGERNEPGFVRFTAEKLAEVREASPDEIFRQTTANACRLFGFQDDEPVN